MLSKTWTDWSLDWIMALHIESSGQGRDLVLIHGWGMHSGCWKEIAGALAERCRVHCVDLPGHGSSPHCGGSWVDALAQALPFDVDLCGWSLGGQLAMEWAWRHPDQVGKLALVSSTPRFTATENWAHGIPGEIFQQFSDMLERDTDAALKRFLFLQTRGETDAARLFRQLQRLAGSSAQMEGLRTGLELLRKYDLREAAQSIGQRTLILHGACDGLTPFGAGAWLREHMPNACLVAAPGCAHAPFLSDPATCISNLLEFFYGH